MYLIIVGALTVLYCGAWLTSGLLRGRLLDNFLKMIDRDSDKFTVMLVGYALGVAMGIALIVLGIRQL